MEKMVSFLCVVLPLCLFSCQTDEREDFLECGAGTEEVDSECIVIETLECGAGTEEVDGECIAVAGGDGEPCYGNDTCDDGLECQTGTCQAITCTPDCSDRECGSDGCDGTCGPGCEPWQNCTTDGQCFDVGCVEIQQSCPRDETPPCCTGGGAYESSCNGTESEPGVLRCCVPNNGDCRHSGDCCDPFVCLTYIDGFGNVQERCLPE